MTETEMGAEGALLGAVKERLTPRLLRMLDILTLPAEDRAGLEADPVWALWELQFLVNEGLALVETTTDPGGCMVMKPVGCTDLGRAVLGIATKELELARKKWPAMTAFTSPTRDPQEALTSFQEAAETLREASKELVWSYPGTETTGPEASRMSVEALAAGLMLLARMGDSTQHAAVGRRFGDGLLVAMVCHPTGSTGSDSTQRATLKRLGWSVVEEVGVSYESPLVETWGFRPE